MTPNRKRHQYWPWLWTKINSITKESIFSPEILAEPIELLELLLPPALRILDLLPCDPPLPTCSLSPPNFHFPDLIPTDPPSSALLRLDQSDGLSVVTKSSNGLGSWTKEKQVGAIWTLEHKLSSGVSCRSFFGVIHPNRKKTWYFPSCYHIMLSLTTLP